MVVREKMKQAAVTVHRIMETGDDIWRYVGKLTEAQRSMLDDIFKWKAREMDKRKEGKPGEARGALRHSVRDNGSDLAEPSGEVFKSSGPIFNRIIITKMSIQKEGMRFLWRGIKCLYQLLLQMAPQTGMKLSIL